MTDKTKMINAGRAYEPKTAKANPAGGSKSVVSDTKLSSAMGHLKAEHPEVHSDRGPHHGGESHLTHMPLHGLKSR